MSSASQPCQHHATPKPLNPLRLVLVLQYDWRLSPKRLSLRDDFFTQVKLGIEKAFLLNRMPAVLIGHSLGSMVIGQFFQWLQVNFPHTYLGWTSKHVVSFYSIGMRAPPVFGTCIDPVRYSSSSVGCTFCNLRCVNRGQHGPAHHVRYLPFHHTRTFVRVHDVRAFI